MTAAVSLPFFPTDLFTDERDVLMEIVRRNGSDPRQRFILGERTAAFERALRVHTGAADVVACGSGTTALMLVLRAMGIGRGHEVVVPAFGCAPLAASVVNVGATPVFADVDPHTMVVQPAEVRRVITARTAAIMPAHVFSVMADMPRLRDIAAATGVRLVEDSAVAQGGVIGGVPAGRWGDAGVYSFVQVKTFGTIGEGGAVVTDDPELGRLVRMLRNHGQDGSRRFVHHLVGFNSRFDEIMAEFQLHRLPGLDARLRRRAAIGEYYTERFTGLVDRGVRPPPAGGDGRCYYVYSLLAERRDELRRHLAGRGVGSHVYYPAPLPAQRAFARYAGYAGAGRWPNAEWAAVRTLALPIYPHLTDAEVEFVADAVCDFVTSVKGRG